MPPSKKVVTAISAVFTATVLAGFSPRRLPTMSEELALARQTCPASCSACIPSIEHRNNATEGSHTGGVHGCFDAGNGFGCEELHACGGSFSALTLPALERLAAQNDMSRLLAALRSPNIDVVPERGVVQFRSDCGSVIAQIPLDMLSLRGE